MDSQLIPIIEQQGTQAVSANALHSFLEVQTRFDMWAKRMFEYGFEEGKDFCTFLCESNFGRPATDYALTFDCAKEIAMIQRTEKGKQARQYFIEVEKRYRAQVKPLSQLDIIEISIQQLKAQDARITAVETQVQEVAAKLITIDTNYYAIAGYYQLHKRTITLREAQETARKCRKAANEMGIPIEKTYDAKYGQVNTYHKDVLQIVTGF